jgi:hypothetical protein
MKALVADRAARDTLDKIDERIVWFGRVIPFR